MASATTSPWKKEWGKYQGHSLAPPVLTRGYLLSYFEGENVKFLDQIQWSHATNSEAELRKALENAEVHMIEADILMGDYKRRGSRVSEDSKDVPIMAHPPNTSSDLS